MSLTKARETSETYTGGLIMESKGSVKIETLRTFGPFENPKLRFRLTGYVTPVTAPSIWVSIPFETEAEAKEFAESHGWKLIGVS